MTDLDCCVEPKRGWCYSDTTAEAWQKSGDAGEDAARELFEDADTWHGRIHIFIFGALTVIAVGITILGTLYAAFVYIFLGGNFPWLP